MHYNGAYSTNAGVSRVALGLGKALEKKGIGIDYLYGYSAPKGMHSYLSGLNGRLHFLHHSPLTALLFAKWIKGKEFDVVHSHTPEAAFDAVIARALLRKKYKIVVHLHGLDKGMRKEWLKEVKNGFVDYSIKQDLYLRASIFKSFFGMKFSDSFTSVSSFVAGQAKRFYGCNSTVVPSTVDCSEFKKTPKEKAKKNLGLEKEFVVLFVGNASWVKGLKYLAEAVSGLENTLLLVVGMWANCEVKDFLKEKVRFDGPVKHGLLAQYYCAADVLCVPSVYEAFGLIYAEAECLGVPCIGSRGTGAEEIIRDGKNGFLVEKRNVEELRNAIKKALKKKFFFTAKPKTDLAQKIISVYGALK